MDKRYMFRGRSINSGLWFYGQPHKHNENTVFIAGGNVIDWDAEWISIEYWARVDSATLGQCTGLIATKSYRGDSEDARLVFEGDIVNVAYLNNGEEINERHEVTWDDTNGSFSPWNWSYSCDGCECYSEIESVEIIGTIHDHPELLNGENENE